jgi:tetratricopeptide (TPR) repeat protein
VLIRRLGKPTDARSLRLLAAARDADPDPFRDKVRVALLDPDETAREAALKALAADPKAKDLPPASAVLLAASLRDDEAAVALLRAAAGRHPDDAWVNEALGQRLGNLRDPPREEQVRYYSAARALRPGRAHHLAHLLDEMRRTDEALAVFADLAARRPHDVGNLVCYGTCLKVHGRREAASVFERAAAAARAAVGLRPDDASAHSSLGHVLKAQGKLAEAAAELRAALRLDPDLPGAHSDLGDVLLDQGRPADAIAEYRTALQLWPDNPLTLNSFGHALRMQGRPAEAATAFRFALELRPDLPGAYANLGAALLEQGKTAEAAAELRTAVRLGPNLAEARVNLGAALGKSGDLPGAIAEFRAAIRQRPDYAEAHTNLGLALRQQGQFAESLAELRTGHELGSKRADWRLPSAAWVAQAARLAAQAHRLPAVLGGTAQPADVAERLGFARMAYDTRRYAGAARLWGDALDADPKLAADRRAQRPYNAACAAALAAAGQGEDDPRPDDAARAKLRAQALAWLKAELAIWSRVIDAGPPQARPLVRQTLQHWKADRDLAGVRDPEALAELPAAERAAWAALWADVDGLLRDVAFPADPFRRGRAAGAGSRP